MEECRPLKWKENGGGNKKLTVDGETCAFHEAIKETKDTAK